MTPRQLDTSVARINRVLKELSLPDVEHVAVGHTVAVCAATGEEWDAFVASEEQAYPAKYLAWEEDTEHILIVEFPGRQHEAYAEALRYLFHVSPVVHTSLKALGSSFDSTGRRFEPDLSYGPKRTVAGAVRPNGIEWPDFLTMRVEIGVSQGWGTHNGQLDHKAQMWARRPGIAYVLCVQLPSDLQSGSYKLYHVPGPRGEIPPPVQLVSAPIAPPATPIHLDSRRLLGLPYGAVLPIHFPDPALVIDLNAALEEARSML